MRLKILDQSPKVSIEYWAERALQGFQIQPLDLERVEMISKMKYTYTGYYGCGHHLYAYSNKEELDQVDFIESFESMVCYLTLKSIILIVDVEMGTISFL